MAYRSYAKLVNGEDELMRTHVSESDAEYHTSRMNAMIHRNRLFHRIPHLMRYKYAYYESYHGIWSDLYD